MNPMPLMTVQQHILEEQRRRHPHASGEFSWLLSGITLATKIVAAQVRRAGLADILGITGGENVQGEVVQKLDVLANQALHGCLGNRGNVAIMASEENEANADSFPRPYRRFLARLRAGDAGRIYSSRYIGSLVADFHRTLIKGGVFLYPPTKRYPEGKLRLMYEANPIAFLAEQAGGVATDGRQPILDVEPTGLHQRCPLLVGSKAEMMLLMGMLN